MFRFFSIFFLFSFNILSQISYAESIFIKKKNLNDNLINFLSTKNLKYVNSKFSLKYFSHDSKFYQKIEKSTLENLEKNKLEFLYYKKKNSNNPNKNKCLLQTLDTDKKKISAGINLKILKNSLMLKIEQKFNNDYIFNSVEFDESFIPHIKTLNFEYIDNNLNKLSTFDFLDKDYLKTNKFNFFGSNIKDIKIYFHFKKNIDTQFFLKERKNIEIDFIIKDKVSKICEKADYTKYDYFLEKKNKIFVSKIDSQNKEILNYYFKLNPIIFSSNKIGLKFVENIDYKKDKFFIAKTEIISIPKNETNVFKDYFFSFDGIFISKEIYEEYFNSHIKNKNFNFYSLIFYLLIIFIFYLQNNFKFKPIDLIYLPTILLFIFFSNFYLSLILIILSFVIMTIAKEIINLLKINNYLIVPGLIILLYFVNLNSNAIYFYLFLSINLFRSYYYDKKNIIN